jgi:hypothetical protein
MKLYPSHGHFTLTRSVKKNYCSFLSTTVEITTFSEDHGPSLLLDLTKTLKSASTNTTTDNNQIRMNPCATT